MNKLFKLVILAAIIFGILYTNILPITDNNGAIDKTKVFFASVVYALVGYIVLCYDFSASSMSKYLEARRIMARDI